jgi:hypothetical protein
MELVEAVRTAKQYLKDCKRDAPELCETYLTALADGIISRRCPFLDDPRNRHMKPEKIAHEIRELKKREKKRSMFRQISHCLLSDNLNLGGLSAVHIPAGNSQPFPVGPDPKTWKGAWTTITNPDHIAHHICSSNTRQYNKHLHHLPVSPCTHILALTQTQMAHHFSYMEQAHQMKY